MLKLLVAAGVLASAFSPSPASLASTESGIAPWQHPEVVKVDCGDMAGSAFRVGPRELISVNHVTSLPGCTINGEPFTVVSHSGDFSILRVPTASRNYLKIDCDGFVVGRRYEAVGYGRGLDTLTTVDLTATGQKLGQLSILVGVFTVVPGQSGGVLLDEDTGEAVGTVNTYGAEDGSSGSVSLSSTAVCHA